MSYVGETERETRLMNYGDEKCDVCHREALIAMSLCSSCADERDHLRARLAEVERERAEARGRAERMRESHGHGTRYLSDCDRCNPHRDEPGCPSCGDDIPWWPELELARAELERLRAVVDAARVLNHRLGFLPYLTLAEEAGGSYSVAAEQVAEANIDLETALAAPDGKEGGDG